MEGSLRKRGDKWYYSFEASTVDGKRKRIERVGGRTKKEAAASLRKALQEYKNAGLHFEPSEISVADYMDYWYENYVLVNCKYNTQCCYQGIIKNHIKPAIGFYKLKSLTPAVLQEFINSKYLIGISKNFLANMLGVLSGSLRSAVYPYNFIKDNPMQYVRAPKYERQAGDNDQKIITHEDFQTIIDRFPPGSAFYMALIIGYYTGCRIGEVTSLTWDDIDLSAGTIDVNKSLYYKDKNWYFGSTKTKTSVRTILIGKTLIEALKQHRKWQMENQMRYGQHYTVQHEVEEDHGNRKYRRIYSLESSIELGKGKKVQMVCTKGNGEMMTSNTFKYAARVIHYELGIDFNFHSLRHTHATTLIENGANIKDVQARLGHANIQITLDTYAHVTEKMSKESVDIFEKAVGTNLPTI